VTDCFPDSARRHRSDAKHLAANRRFQNAGHLLGFAAECLAKEILAGAGITLDKSSGLREHFPQLGNQIRRNGRTRVMTLLTPIVRRSTFLDGWTAECRYEANISQADAEIRFNSWHADVEALFKTAGIP
jgi:hypothetical protein